MNDNRRSWHALSTYYKSNEILQKNFKKMKFMNAEKLASQCVSLPIDPMLKKEMDLIIKVQIILSN